MKNKAVDLRRDIRTCYKLLEKACGDDYKNTLRLMRDCAIEVTYEPDTDPVSSATTNLKMSGMIIQSAITRLEKAQITQQQLLLKYVTTSSRKLINLAPKTAKPWLIKYREHLRYKIKTLKK